MLSILGFIFLIGFGFLVKYHNKNQGKGKAPASSGTYQPGRTATAAGQPAWFGRRRKLCFRRPPLCGRSRYFRQAFPFPDDQPQHHRAGQAEIGRLAKSALPISRKLWSGKQPSWELGSQLDWRQDFQAYGRDVHEDENDIATLLQWIQEPAALKNQGLYLIFTFAFAAFIHFSCHLIFRRYGSFFCAFAGRCCQWTGALECERYCHHHS